MTIRDAQLEDLPAIEAIYHHYVRTTPITFDIEPTSRRPWFEKFDGAKFRCLVAVSDRGVEGYACSMPFRAKAAYETSVEVSIYVDHASRGGGHGRRLYEALFDALRGLDLNRAYAGITMPNEASLKLHQAFGFNEIGRYTEVGRKFGQYWDVVWLEKRLGQQCIVERSVLAKSVPKI